MRWQEIGFELQPAAAALRVRGVSSGCSLTRRIVAPALARVVVHIHRLGLAFFAKDALIVIRHLRGGRPEGGDDPDGLRGQWVQGRATRTFGGRIFLGPPSSLCLHKPSYAAHLHIHLDKLVLWLGQTALDIGLELNDNLRRTKQRGGKRRHVQRLRSSPPCTFRPLRCPSSAPAPLCIPSTACAALAAAAHLLNLLAVSDGPAPPLALSYLRAWRRDPV